MLKEDFVKTTVLFSHQHAPDSDNNLLSQNNIACQSDYLLNINEDEGNQKPELLQNLAFNQNHSILPKDVNIQSRPSIQRSNAFFNKTANQVSSCSQYSQILSKTNSPDEHQQKWHPYRKDFKINLSRRILAQPDVQSLQYDPIVNSYGEVVGSQLKAPRLDGANVSPKSRINATPLFVDIHLHPKQKIHKQSRATSNPKQISRLGFWQIQNQASLRYDKQKEKREKGIFSPQVTSNGYFTQGQDIQMCSTKASLSPTNIMQQNSNNIQFKTGRNSEALTLSNFSPRTNIFSQRTRSYCQGTTQNQLPFIGSPTSSGTQQDILQQIIGDSSNNNDQSLKNPKINQVNEQKLPQTPTFLDSGKRAFNQQSFSNQTSIQQLPQEADFLVKVVKDVSVCDLPNTQQQSHKEPKSNLAILQGNIKQQPFMNTLNKFDVASLSKKRILQQNSYIYQKLRKEPILCEMPYSFSEAQRLEELEFSKKRLEETIKDAIKTHGKDSKKIDSLMRKMRNFETQMYGAKVQEADRFSLADCESQNKN